MLGPDELFPEVPNLYEFLSTHSNMVYDKERFSRYWEAISMLVKPGDVVADIGTGTGLLAFLCLRTGAKHVHAIEKSGAIKWAKLLADHHNLSNRITFYAADSRNVELPEKVDVVISELIGHIAFEEGMAESLFDARSRFLSSDGRIVPRTMSLMASPVCKNDVYEKCVNCWQNIYGFDYSLLRQDALRSCYITEILDDNLMSLSEKVFFLDFTKGEQPSELSGSVQFTIYRHGEVNGIAFWFEAELATDVYLSSGPRSRTHWGQCFAPINKPITVKKGDTVEVQIMMRMRKQIQDTFKFFFRIGRRKFNG